MQRVISLPPVARQQTLSWELLWQLILVQLGVRISSQEDGPQYEVTVTTTQYWTIEYHAYAALWPQMTFGPIVRQDSGRQRCNYVAYLFTFKFILLIRTFTEIDGLVSYRRDTTGADPGICVRGHPRPFPSPLPLFLSLLFPSLPLLSFPSLPSPSLSFPYLPLTLEVRPP